MKRYYFKLELVGMGETPEKAWFDAVENFNMDPGPPPEDEKGELDYRVEDDEEEEEPEAPCSSTP